MDRRSCHDPELAGQAKGLPSGIAQGLGQGLRPAPWHKIIVFSQFTYLDIRPARAGIPALMGVKATIPALKIF